MDLDWLISWDTDIHYYVPTVGVLHMHAQPTKNYFKSTELNLLVIGSQLYYFKNYRKHNNFEIKFALLSKYTYLFGYRYIIFGMKKIFSYIVYHFKVH